jgi:UDP-N-acetylglucosamine 2-epimerase (non-hydrolysing)
MIVFIYGTTAEAIKLAPIMRRLDVKGVRYQQWVTYQHTKALDKVIADLGIPAPDRVIANGSEGNPLRTKSDVIRWLLAVRRWIGKNRLQLKAELPGNSVVVVHGDTLTSVVGAYIARRLKVPSAHVEAGLRSGNWRHPFPEELDRRIVGRLATIHYAPSEESVANLKGKANVIHTHGNTVIDAVLDHVDSHEADAEPFGLVLLHRYEFISNRPLVDETVRTLAEKSPHPLRLITDAYSEAALRESLASIDAKNVAIEPKLSHDDFIRVVRQASFIVTDSGGIQEEAALIGVPTMVHRKTSERNEGLGENISLSDWDSERLSGFLTEHESYRRPSGKPKISPSDLIVDDLLARDLA